MEYNEALSELKNVCKITEVSPEISNVEIDLMLSTHTFCKINLINENNQAVLNDMASTANVLDVSEETLTNVCKKHNLSLNNWHIKTNYNSLTDLKNFISALQELSEL